MKQQITSFLMDDTASITVDWVVLTAALIGIAMLVLGPIAFEMNSLADRVGAWVGDTDVGVQDEPEDSDEQGG